MEKREKLYEGKAKIVYATDDPGKVIQYFKDDATAFNALKRGTILGKGVINNKMSATLFQRLAKAGIPTHYLATLSDREMLCRKLDIIKIEVISRNIVAGSLAKRTGLEEGVPIKPPIVELYYKSDPLGDPMFTEDHVRMLKLASPKEVAWLKRMALKINALLRPLLKRKGLILVDFKLEFGATRANSISATRSVPTPAGCGTPTPSRSSTRTASVATSETSRMRTRRSTAASWARARESPRPRAASSRAFSTSRVPPYSGRSRAWASARCRDCGWARSSTSSWTA
jgi:phosphoribosylaminoimidazole-succinocarboxamide synthase